MINLFFLKGSLLLVLNWYRSQLKKKSIRKDCGNKPFRMLFAIFLHAFSLRMGDRLRCHLLQVVLAELEGMDLLLPEQ